MYLVEGIKGAFPFLVDRTKISVSESSSSTPSRICIPGRFSLCDTVNGNNRRYSKQVWEKNIQPDSLFQRSIARNDAFGLLEHPEDGIVTLRSPISHLVAKVQLVESKDASKNSIWEVIGEITLTDTPEGKKLRALIEAGYNPMVSSRGYGTLVKGVDGVDDVQVDYVCEGFDVVLKPSENSAELHPIRPLSPSTKLVSPVESTSPVESAENLSKVNLRESSPQTSVVEEVKYKPSNIMEISEIKTRINFLNEIDLTKSGSFAESAAQIEQLHKEVAEWGASDSKRSWEVQKLHKALESIENKFSQAVHQPAKDAKRLQEQNIKLMRVVDAVARTAVTYKKRLGEALKGDQGQTELVMELTRRGQGWQHVAESRKNKYLKLEGDFSTACDALDLMAVRYHEDVTELGRRLIVLEFKEKAQTPEIQKLLKEATRLRHIVAIREKLELKEEKGDPGGKQPKEGEDPGKEALKDEKQKGTSDPKAAEVASEPGKVASESKDRGPLSVRAIDESVEIVKRLSAAASLAQTI